MNRKGFTLIELLAAIVIVCLLAVLASTSVTKTVKNSKSDLYQNQLNLIEKAARIWAADNMNKLPEDGECKFITLGQLKNYGLLDSSIKNPKNNQEFPNNLKVKISSTQTEFNSVLSYEVDSRNTNSCLNVSGCTLTLDQNNNKKADIGDMITCASESFHVIKNDGDTISMLAQYNLDVGSIYYSYYSKIETIENSTGLQKEVMKGIDSSPIWYGVIPFSDTYYWYDFTNNKFTINSEDRHPFVYGDYKDETGNYLNKIYPYIKNYEEYLIKEGVTSARGTLISEEQITDLWEYSWIFTTSYWTGSAKEPNLEDNFGVSVWSVNSEGSLDGGFNFDDTYGQHSYGVRPVINISVYEL